MTMQMTPKEIQALISQVEFPDPLRILFQPNRYKVLYGGRGAGRSWGIARALLLQGAMRPLRVLCARELQNSLSESVHQLLRDQINALGLDRFYTVQEQIIFGPNGTQFTFAGIRNNYTKIKSYEGIDICWVEEANKVSENSWLNLIPTIRKAGSEIWLSFNPELEDDYTYDYFVKNAEERHRPFVVKMTWRDNPWFPDELRDEKDKLKRLDYDKYLNVWEGFCLETLEGTVYVNEMRKVIQEGRIMQVPWDRATPVDTYWDLGRADATAIWFVQRVAMQWRILHYYQGTGEDIHHYIKYCQRLPYLYGSHNLPHDAKAKKLVYKNSIEEIVRESSGSVKVRVLPVASIQDGINAARMVFPNCYFDEKGTQEGVRALKAYRFKMMEGGPTGRGQRSNVPVHDWASDGADAFRMFAMGIKNPTGALEATSLRLSQQREHSIQKLKDIGSHSWLGQ